ncbi:hypothetical protein N0V83_002728 [Neocucurbitaria cava]|uniref:DUF7587 domain-containing protein n=1 Tax=Neocucurbitaria cava TaxID=798079 RepID=A0A9W8YCP6_9PLEO|nr:hypothetical protein N0V83_002728 [Neocucurbitaria cava]
MPSGSVGLNATQRSLSRLSIREDSPSGLLVRICDPDEQDSVLPSIEDFFERVTDAEPERENEILSFKSPGTLPSSSNDGIPTPDTLSPCTLSRSSSATFSSPVHNIFDQLKLCAFSSEECQPDVISSPITSPEEYDSDRTDFLLTPKTPCPRRGALSSKRRTETTSRFFNSNNRTKASKDVCRILDFGGVVKRKTLKPTLRVSQRDVAPEYSNPRRCWSDDERTFLCVLWRWYERQPVDFTKIVCTFFGLDLPVQKVIGQHDHIRANGAKAYPNSFGQVMAVPFHDPDGVYDDVRSAIETTAKELDIEIVRLQEEVTYRSNHAATAKSPGTRKKYKSLIQKAALEWDLRAVQPPLVIRRLRGTTLSATSWEEDEVLTDSERNEAKSSSRPHLVFRVWEDGASLTNYDGGFTAGAFKGWPRPYPAPIAPDDPSQAFTILARLHLSRKGHTPCFIATSSSLLQVLVIASTLNRPRLAVIDLNSKCLQEAHKISHAAKVFNDLKRAGIEVPRYKGFGDWFVWAEIPQEAVIHTMYLGSVNDLSDRDPHCAKLLNLSAFNGSSTKEVASKMRDRNLHLNIQTARALGTISRVFAMNAPKAALKHITELVARFIDGFYIQVSPCDIHTMSSLAGVFARALGTHPVYSHQQVMGAFMEGVSEGEKSAKRWSRSSSSSGGKRAKRRKDCFIS